MKASMPNTLSATATLPGAVAAYFWLGELHELTPYILALSAVIFIHIAVADLIPGLHRQTNLAAVCINFYSCSQGLEPSHSFILEVNHERLG